jgi:hypothetical protein
MNGDVHYEVVLASDGRHAVWFSDAVRSDLPASLARDVTMQVSRPDAPVEHLALQIDDAGESWVARGRPVGGDDVLIKLRYVIQGEAHEVEIPFVPKAERSGAALAAPSAGLQAHHYSRRSATIGSRRDARRAG